jgi:hypothetical protein
MAVLPTVFWPFTEGCGMAHPVPVAAILLPLVMVALAMGVFP